MPCSLSMVGMNKSMRGWDLVLHLIHHHYYQYILRRWVRMHLIPERYLSFKPEECFKLTTVHNIQQKRVVLQAQNTWLSLDISTNQVVHICCWHEPHRRMSGLQKPSIAWKLDAFHTLKIIWQQAVSTNLWIWWFMKPMVWCVNTVPLANGSCIAR